MANQEITGEYSEVLRKIEATDKVTTTIFNPLFNTLINNDANFRKNIIDEDDTKNYTTQLKVVSGKPVLEYEEVL